MNSVDMLETLKDIVWGMAAIALTIAFLVRLFKSDKDKVKTLPTPPKLTIIAENLKRNARLISFVLAIFLMGNLALVLMLDQAQQWGYIGQNPDLDSFNILASIVIGIEFIILAISDLPYSHRFAQAFRLSILALSFIAYFLYLLWFANIA